MRFEATPLAGVLRVHAGPHSDERGSFARLHCEREFAARGLPERMVQTSVSHTLRAGTVRGLHFLWPPAREAKLVRCIAGEIFDVVVDLRTDSPTFGSHAAFVLAAAGSTAVFVPAGCAHGFQSLVDDSRLLYQMTDFYAPELADGVRWNDPAFGIRWPLPATQMHPRDAAYPDFDAPAFRATWAARAAERAER
jgi:dTDP-4-dehydrorhamnose 3,5-epimerase